MTSPNERSYTGQLNWLNLLHIQALPDQNPAIPSTSNYFRSNFSLFHRVQYLFLRFALFLFILTGSARETFAADFYFSNSEGKDDRSTFEAQSPSTPWQSIKKLNEHMPNLKPGDRVLFKRGEKFFGSIQIDGSGIVFGAYGVGEKPIITSLKRIAQWEDNGNGIFYSNLEGLQSKDLAILLIDQEVQEVGRYPNSSDSNGGFLSITELAETNIIGPNIPFNTQGAEIVIRKNNWIIDRFPVETHHNNTIEITNDSSYPVTDNFGFFIQKHIETLDKYGEWFFDKTTKRLYVYFGEKNPKDHMVEAAMNDHLVATKDKTRRIGIKLEDLDIRGSNSNILDVNHVINFQLYNCELSYSGRDGIHLYAVPNHLIEENTISYCLNNGIFIWYGGTKSQISKNRIQHTMPFVGMSQNSDLNGIGIYLAADSDGSKVSENQITNTGYSAIYFGGDWVTVSKNYIEGFCQLKYDGGGIYTNSQGLDDRNCRDRVIDHNIVINSKPQAFGIPETESPPLIEGIYLDDNSRGLAITNNTVAIEDGRGIYLHNARNIKIKNNLLYNNSFGIYLSHDQLGNPIRDVEIFENTFLSKNEEQQFIGISSILDDVSLIGFIDNNYYFDPFSSVFTFQDLSKAKFPPTERNLLDWSRTNGFDLNSKYFNLNFRKFEISSSQSLVESDFSTGDDIISGIYKGTSSLSNIDTNDSALRINTLGNEPTTVFIQIGKINPEEKIWFEIKAKGSIPNNKISVYLEKSHRNRQSTSPGGFLSSIDFTESKILLTSLLKVPNESIVISIPPSTGEVYITELKISKARTTDVFSDDKILFSYNTKDFPITQNLNGTYTDATGKQHENSIEIPPHSGIILIKGSEL